MTVATIVCFMDSNIPDYDYYLIHGKVLILGLRLNES